MAPGEGAHARAQCAAELDGRLGLAKGVVEADPFLRQGIHVWCLYHAMAACVGNVVGAVRVEADQDDVHGYPLELSRWGQIGASGDVQGQYLARVVKGRARRERDGGGSAVQNLEVLVGAA